ncbi:MAG: hypothetical protein AAFQ43_06505 [Bacteroidota bacterium]
MRLLLLPLAALAACASPCETLDAAQDNPAAQTCVFSASVDEDGAFSTDEGAPVAFDAPAPPFIEGAFPDGSQIQNDVWVASGEAPPADRDSALWVAAAALAPEAGRYALGMQTDGTVRVRDASGQPLATVRVADGENATAARMGVAGQPNRAAHLDFSPDGATLYGADTQGNVFAWDAASGAVLWSGAVPLDHGGEDGRAVKPDAIRALRLSNDGARLAAATTQRVTVWDAASGAEEVSWAIPRRKTSVIGVGFAPGGEHVAVMNSGRYVPPSVRYSSFDETGQYTGASEKLDVDGYQRAPTVFLLAMP